MKILLSIIAIHISISAFINSLTTSANIKLTTKDLKRLILEKTQQIELIYFNSGSLSGKIKISKITNNNSNEVSISNQWFEVEAYHSREITIPIEEGFITDYFTVCYFTLSEGKIKREKQKKIKIMRK
ncbi:MAG: hypothetical protein GF364_09915 [Candidatus Lokiarchaeota archaeon]|nr:hypothetical protein [Candidatus Lokiarchaeota archaeon]